MIELASRLLVRRPAAPRSALLSARGTVAVATADGRAVCAECRVARTAPARMRGLLGRRGLAAGEGLLIRPAPSIHTLFMRFPIDVVFVARDGEVLRVVAALPPWRLAGCKRAAAVLELGAGAAARAGLVVGDRLTVAEEGR